MVLGGGIGGLVAANELQRLLRQHSIILIEKNVQHAFAPSFLWLMTGDRSPAQITRPLRKLLAPGIQLAVAPVNRIDLEQRFVYAGPHSIAYDYLIIALGAELAWDTIPGISSAHTFYTFEGASKLKDALLTFYGGTIAIVVTATPYKCPGAPHEGAMLLADFFRRQGLKDKVRVHLYTPESQPMPVAGPQLGEAVRQMLENTGIHFHPLHKLVKMDPDSRKLFFEEKEPIGFDLLIVIPPHRAPSVVKEAGLTNDAGWIPVDRSTLATRSEGVYAIGDITSISIPGHWKPDVPLMLPKAGVFAHGQALVAARRISAEINGRSSADSFCGEGYCMLEAGERIGGFAFGNFFAEPSPEVKLQKPGRVWHWGKILFERWWLSSSGPKRQALEMAIRAGAKIYGVPLSL
ncbi:NAD(P)/FAD-dependent oxidoreductase [bacterium]|nr:NAD(P)/FAD-dependent oxidoreductase [bacterium]